MNAHDLPPVNALTDADRGRTFTCTCGQRFVLTGYPFDPEYNDGGMKWRRVRPWHSLLISRHRRRNE